MSGENTETLFLTQLQRESAGFYSCGAQNTEGETRSSTITLKVQCKYIFILRRSIIFIRSKHMIPYAKAICLSFLFVCMLVPMCGT